MPEPAGADPGAPVPAPPRPGPVALVVVLVSALVAAAARLPATGTALRPDESGYTLVARAWSPTAESPFGRYWVDRPPTLVLAFRLADLVPGGHGIRWFGVVAALLAVLVAGLVGREVLARVRPDATPGRASMVVALTALTAAAFVATPQIDLQLTKGELLALPVLLASVWLVLRAVRTGSVPAALVAGVLAGLAPGLKQSLVGAAVFGLALLLLERLGGRLDTRGLVRLGGAFVAGGATPVVGTLVWALVAGVRLGALWESVVGIRGQAVGVIAGGPLGNVLRRAAELALATVTTGLALVLLALLVHVVRQGRRSSPLARAALVMAVVDGLALLLGGFFRLPYLFAMVPSAVLTVALLLAAAPAGGRVGRLVPPGLVAVVVASAAFSGVGWVRDLGRFERPPVAVMAGRAIGAVSQPGDSLTAVLGNADLQYSSGLPSPYEYLWSLPSRVRDPDLIELAGVLRGPDAPTWVVTVYDIRAVQGARAADDLDAALAGRYVDVGPVCGGRHLWRRADRPRPDPVRDCAGLRRGFGQP
ncbi:hypothetical protein [Phycicoccus flavus]|uniref:Uncharacterized protein n=1 Tax=Phycicoccus flavus TaxID=2502783 RepID=A0A8T6R6I2_9MICO|nr:hypothetical protein [Phycicoccus flavus]NHA69577.1 hypothetical protein [Phycicoccus flavus]